jgi:cobalamin biosynthesis Mg chelatase CobN
MLALLALALFPVLAHAENSNEAVYTPVVPKVETKPPTKPKTTTNKSATPHKPSNNAKAEGSATENAGSESSVEPEEEEGSEEGQGKSGGAGGGGGNSHPPNNGGGGEGGGSPSKNGGGAKPADGISGAKVVATDKNPGANVSEASGGSSPVVPILIAVVVLAAISIGVVLYRQRKSGQGPDPRVSSPNAS